MDIRKSPLVNGGLYVAATAGTLYAQVHDLKGLEYACKPLLMLVLSSWFFFNSRRVGDRFTLLIQAGLCFSLIGDIALMFQHLDGFNFLLGLAAFLVAQVCYTLAFLHNVFAVGSGEGVAVSTGISVLVLIYGFVFALDLQPRLDEAMVLPVMVYAVAITLMGISATFRYRRTFPPSFWMVLLGAVCFIASDSLLATNRFVRPLPHGDLWIMSTYVVAQALIAYGALVHVLDPEMIRRRKELET